MTRAVQRRWVSVPNETLAAWFGCLLMLIMIWSSVGWTLVRDVAQTRAYKASQASLYAKGFAEYVGLNLLFVDHLLLEKRGIFARTGSLAPHADLTSKIGTVGDLLIQVAITDASGRVVASSLPGSDGVSIADREHFRVFVDDPSDRLHFSHPVVGRVSKRMSLQVVRPLASPDGTFAGVIVASLDPLDFQRYFLSRDAYGDDGSVTLVGRVDGIVRVRFTRDEITWGTSVRETPLWQTIKRGHQGSTSGVSSIDQKQRIIGFHHVADYPLVATVSVAATRVRQGHQGLLAMVVLTGLLASATLILFTLLWSRTRRQQEQQIERLRELTRRETEANRMKSNFLASVSHDLRTPLNSILGFSELIRDGTQDSQARRFAALIHRSGAHLHALVNTLLDLARIEAGRMELRPERIALRALLSNAVELHRVSAQGRQVALTWATQPTTESTIQTDRTRIMQVLNNLLNNAVKFTNPGGNIHLEGTILGPDLRIVVQDSGRGIPPDRLGKVFDRFSAMSPTQLPGEGSGLGLALCHELLILMNGSIRIESTVGQGTRVEVMLRNCVCHAA